MFAEQEDDSQTQETQEADVGLAIMHHAYDEDDDDDTRGLELCNELHIQFYIRPPRGFSVFPASG